MAAVVDIANLALSHLGISRTLAALSEDSEEARAVSAFYDLVNQQAQREYAWGFNTDFKTLQLIKSNPTTEWTYAYQYPNLCLKLRRIMSGARQDVSESMVPYRLTILDGRSAIFSSQAQAVAEIATYVNDPNLFPPDYTMAFSFLLAFYLAPRVTAGDPFKLGDRAFRAYQMMASKAMSASANEEIMGVPPESELIRVRG